MKIKSTIAKLTFILLMAVASFAKGQGIQNKQAVKALIDKTYAYQLAHPWKEEDYNWIRGTFYTGIMAVFQATGDKKYFDQCEKWGNEYGWKVPLVKPDTKLSGANLLTCSQTWIESYLIKKDKKKINPIIAHFSDRTAKNPMNNPLDWYYESGDRYVDALYVAAPVLAMLYKVTGEVKYASYLDSFFWDVYGSLYDREENLFYRDIRFTPNFKGEVEPKWTLPDSIQLKDARRSYAYQRTAAAKKVLWSRGNGWALGALARILKYLPKNYAGRERYEALYLQMAKSVKESQHSSGYWYPNMADSNDFPYKETSGTGFFVYGLAWGVNNGLLNREEYLPTIEKGWSALYDAVDKEGKVTWGQIVGGSPFVIRKEDSHEYVTGTFLLAASEIYKIK
jgi:unsaturated rhamnogalacturonyl hydrolase